MIDPSGQKQRVTLARAAYSQPAICLLDDPLSALDAGTSKIIFENLRSLLSGSAIVLVTHAAHFLSRVDKILVVSEGRVRFTGTWTELLDFVPADGKTHDAVEHIRSSVQEGSSDRSQSNEASNEIDGVDVRKGKAATLGEKGKLMTVEEREHGLSSLSTWLLWFQRAGGIMFIFAHVFFMTIDRLSYVAVEYWLARWTEGAYKAIDVFGLEFAPQSDGPSAQANYLIVYGLVILASIVTTVLRYVMISDDSCSFVVGDGSRSRSNPPIV
jgi:ATP-binding cassette subfamily C (CFTR/MRP) protein 1